MKLTKGKVFVLFSILLIGLMILIGPIDYFAHGYFANEISVENIPNNQLTSEYDFSKGAYIEKFVPQTKHMSGLQLYFTNQTVNNDGELEIDISDSLGKIIDTQKIPLSKIRDNTWYKIYTHARFIKGNEYTVSINVVGSNIPPHLVEVSSDYYLADITDGHALMTLAYKTPTFDTRSKLLIFIMLISIWLILLTHIYKIPFKKTVKRIGVMGVLLSTLTANYFYNLMDNGNSLFSWFQRDSESVVTGTIYRSKDGAYLSDDGGDGYGLGVYSTTAGYVKYFRPDAPAPLTDENWLDGYARDRTAITVHNNTYNSVVGKPGNKVQFQNGAIREISAVEYKDEIIIFELMGNQVTADENGPISQIHFLDKEGNLLPSVYFESYRSQYGLQGKVFSLLARPMNKQQSIINLKYLCALMTAAVFTVICVLLQRKYNTLLAACFFLVFWLSPWVVDFARNLYWVEFTWFIPTAIGLFCSIHVTNRKARIVSYLLAFLSIMVKCMCGYEYISVIMMGLIIFLLVDFIGAIVSKDTKKARLIFRTTLIIGIFAVLGFIGAICMHANLKGNGDILLGIKEIIKKDVLRRTSGADLNEYNPDYWPAFNASVLEVLLTYFRFSTEIIPGIGGNLFPLLSVVPIAIFINDYRKKEIKWENLTFYILSFFASTSWFILAKSHSYDHTQMNYVLWYFGFIQICIYIICDKFLRLVNNHRVKG